MSAMLAAGMLSAAIRERDLLLSTIDSDGDIALEVRRLRRESRRGQGQTGGESDKNEPAAKV
ncbi:MAG TPA: hypothetical protein VFJ49_03740 [Methyloceanibacter sp.]|jgi:hypothetical protein|nr:hypothetical protein [Methyloceanibacter sp.]